MPRWTQAEVWAICALAYKQKGNRSLAESITFHGDFRGYPVALTMELSDEVFANCEEWAEGTAAALGALGIKPPAPKGAPSYAPKGGGDDGPASGDGCPVHGMSKAKPGYRGQGMECSANAPTKQEWSKEKPAVMNDGTVRFYCKHKW